MARYDVFRLAGGDGYVLGLLGRLKTRVVASLAAREGAPEPAGRLNPIFAIDAVEHVLLAQFISAIPVADLSDRLTNVAHRADDVTEAIGMVFAGF